MEIQPVIGFYCSSTGWSGLQMNLVKRARWWKERGTQTVVFCVDDTPIYRKSKEELLRTERVLKNKRSGDRINARRVHRLCEKHGINTLWITDERDISIAGRVKRLAKSRMLVLYQQAAQIRSSSRSFLNTRRYNRIDIWISPLEFLAKQVQHRTRFPIERLHVIPNGIDIQKLLFQTVDPVTARIRFNLDSSCVVMGIIGRIDPGKGQLFLVSALAELRRLHPDLHLLIVGQKEEGGNVKYEDDVQKLIHKLDIRKFVHIKPFAEDVGAFYAACDIVVVASASETFGMVTLEAMLFGCRIIGTNNGGTPELLGWGDYGELYSPDNMREFCQAFETTIIDEDRAMAKARNARIYSRDRYQHLQECEEIQYLLDTRLKILFGKQKKG